jgi:hypothetical protein
MISWMPTPASQPKSQNPHLERTRLTPAGNVSPLQGPAGGPTPLWTPGAIFDLGHPEGGDRRGDVPFNV